MAFTLLLLISLFLGLALTVIGVMLIVIRKSRLPGLILLGSGILVTVTSIVVFGALMITIRTMG